MKSITHTFGQNPKITIVCGVHGEELFGRSVYNHVLLHAEKLGSFQLILAHPHALDSNVRYFEQDLNRSFPGNPYGSLEEKIAADILPKLQKTPYVIDIHTTVSDVGMVPIITNLNSGTKRLINATEATNIAYIQSDSSSRSLIGQVCAGMALEFNRKLAEDESALHTVATILKRIQNNCTLPPSPRRIFMINGVLKKSLPIPPESCNFTLLNPYGVYPFLLHKDSYPDIHCHTATRYKTMKL